MTVVMRYFEDGGAVAVLIAIVSLLAWFTALRTWLRARLLAKMLADKMSFVALDKLYIDGLILGLERKLQILAAMATVLPLLGLLGTVLGMLITFEVIEGYGTGQPSLLAGGIRRALLTTQLGLWTALPVLLMHEIIGVQTRKAAYEANIQFGNGNSHNQEKQSITTV